MASQMGVFGSGVRRRPGYVDQINAQRSMLPQMIQQKAAAQALKDQQAMQEKQYGLQEREIGISEEANKMKASEIAEAARSNAAQESYNRSSLDLTKRGIDFQKDASKKAAGLEMLKLGVNTSLSGFGKPDGKGFTIGGRTFGGEGSMLSKAGGMLAPAATGALAGYGASQMFGGKSKTKKMMFGAGAGLLTGFLGGGGFGARTLSSGAGGLLGGLFGR